MLSNEHLKLLLQAIAVVLALHFAKGSMTGEYRNLMAVGLVAVVLMVVNRLFVEYEGADINKSCRDQIQKWLNWCQLENYKGNSYCWTKNSPFLMENLWPCLKEFAVNKRPNATLQDIENTCGCSRLARNVGFSCLKKNPSVWEKYNRKCQLMNGPAEYKKCMGTKDFDTFDECVKNAKKFQKTCTDSIKKASKLCKTEPNNGYKTCVQEILYY